MMILRTLIVAACVAVITVGLRAQPESVPIVGAAFDYIVRQGDTWQSISSRYGIAVAALASLNARTSKTAPTVGETVHVDGRHLVPNALSSGIVINIPQRMLFVIEDGAALAAYPVGLGRPDWATFVGAFTVVAAEEDPVWDVPASIQEEQRRAGKKVLTRVAPGPANPLGKYWFGLSVPGFGIHGTNARLSIYRFETHGCIRLHPDDIAKLWSLVAIGTPGKIIYEPVLLAFLPQGLLLEAHPDIYRRSDIAADEALVRQAAIARRVGDLLDWRVVRQVLQARDGQPHALEFDTPASAR